VHATLRAGHLDGEDALRVAVVRYGAQAGDLRVVAAECFQHLGEDAAGLLAQGLEVVLVRAQRGQLHQALQIEIRITSSLRNRWWNCSRKLGESFVVVNSQFQSRRAIEGLSKYENRIPGEKVLVPGAACLRQRRSIQNTSRSPASPRPRRAIRRAAAAAPGPGSGVS
jgi:hypothetical protein